MNYRNVYRVLSVKNAYFVLKEIYDGCSINDFRSFENLQNTLKMNKSSLRRITNRLSAAGLIHSIKDNTLLDGRKRVFVISDIKLYSLIADITRYIAR